MARPVTIRAALVVAIATMATACAPLPHRPFRDVEASAAVAGGPVASTLSRVGFAPANATAARRIDTVDRIWRTIDQRYYDPGVNGVDLGALRERSEAGAREAASDADFYRVLQRDVNAVGDSHTPGPDPASRERVRRRTGRPRSGSTSTCSKDASS